ncbi:TRAP transporter small permease subunit [Maritimibacter sp. UBA3975]|uniref:TRAP transporter small permease n=1 Tax=Maritimibacter sp. UBA3975 TaxID=1946833 RepID=UPI000C0A90BC|nr:TRAP transporter small permease subunit [Maritimibacter sp. UBA3975]MAM63321.1 C4-dicarboxylate ABC transporter permease [Maritimibacter sp.]|tara:strand:- start:26598 stop:27119 length:522 start_codon:yes stop_codon:yes gene_type:complete
MDRLKTVWTWLGRRAENFLALLLFSMFVTFLLQVVFRYFLNLPVGWTVEWVTIAWLWGILFGFAFVVRETDIIRLDVLYSALPRGPRRVMDVFTGLTIAGIFLYTLPASWDYIDFMMRERTAYIRVPFFWVFIIYIPFALSVAVRGLMTAWAGITGSGPRFDTGASAETHDYD